MDFTRSERIYLRLHPELNEKWVQELIASDPSILGLGELVLRDKERIQPRAGRLATGCGFFRLFNFVFRPLVRQVFLCFLLRSS
jgi:hypothetical protein